MRYLNPLRTKVLITADEVVFHAPVDHTLDPRTIQPSIIVAERRFILPMLGFTVYNALLNAKNQLVTTSNKAALQTAINEDRPTGRELIVLTEGDYVSTTELFTFDQYTLWTNFLHKIIAECVWYVALPVNRARFTTAGVEVNNPESIGSAQKSASIDLANLKYLMDRGLQDRISPLMKDLHEYMCGVAYPGYTKKCDCDSDGKPYRKRSDILFGLYDHDDRRNCDGPPSRSVASSDANNYSSKNEVVSFTNVSTLRIYWNSARIIRFGEAGVFYVEIWNDDGEVRRTDVQAQPDDPDTTSYYDFTFGELATGRVVIT